MSAIHSLSASLLKLCNQQFTDRSDQFFQRWQDKILKVLDRISKLPNHAQIINQCGEDHLSPLTWLMKNQVPDALFETLSKDFLRLGAHPITSKECIEVLCSPVFNIRRTLFAMRVLTDLEDANQMPPLPEQMPLMCYPAFFRKSFLLSEAKSAALSKWLSESQPDTGMRPLHVILRNLTAPSEVINNGLIYDGGIREDMFWKTRVFSSPRPHCSRQSGRGEEKTLVGAVKASQVSAWGFGMPRPSRASKKSWKINMHSTHYRPRG